MKKTEELRKKAKALLDQAKKIEEEATLKLGAVSAKFVTGQIDINELKAKAEELGFDVKIKSSSHDEQQNRGGEQ